MFTEEIKADLSLVLSEAGFKYLEGPKYHFKNSATSSRTNFIKALGFPSTLKTKPHLKELYINFLEDSFPNRDFDEYVIEYSSTRKPLRVATYNDAFGEVEDQKNYFSTLVPVIDMHRQEDRTMYLLDPATDMRPIYDFNPHTVIASLGSHYDKLVADDSTLKAIGVFNPYRTDTLYREKLEDAHYNMLRVNTYVPPSWRFVQCEGKLTGVIKKIVDHLFPIESEKEAVLDWFHYSLVYRCETVLCLIGARGTGKGLLANEVHSRLIGEKYREVVPQAILSERFNGSFQKRRYLFFDEVDVSGPVERQKLKAFANKTIAMEKKGKDSLTIDNFCSMALTSNEKGHICVQPQERRFSIPEVTEKPINAILPEKEVIAFLERIAKPDSIEIAEFGNFLLNRKPKTLNQTPIKGEYYFEISKLSMPEWQSFLVDYFESNRDSEVIQLKQMRKLFMQYSREGKFPNKMATFKDFLGDYKYEGICKIAKVVSMRDADKGRETFGFVITDEFKNYRSENKKVTLDDL